MNGIRSMVCGPHDARLLSCQQDLKALDRALSAPLDLKATAVLNLPVYEVEEAAGAGVAGASQSRSRGGSLGEMPRDAEAGVKPHPEAGAMARGSPWAEDEREGLALRQDEKDVAELEAAERELEALKAAHVGRQSELQGLYRRRAISPPQPTSSRAATEASLLDQQIWVRSCGQ